MNVESLTRRVREKIIVGNMRKGRPKKTWEETVIDDMRNRNLTIEDANGREKWRRRCRQLDSPDDSG